MWLGLVSDDINNRKFKANLKISDESIESADFGRICVLGDEAAGKSSVFARLLQLKIFQIGENLITWHPLVIHIDVILKHVLQKFCLFCLFD